MTSSFRAAHGAQREAGRLTASECPPTDELHPGIGSEPGPRTRQPNGRFAPGNDGYAAVQRGLPKGALLAPKDPAWRAARRLGRQAATRRIVEVAQAHGGSLSSGVCRLLRDASDLHADAQYLRARAAADDNTDLLRTAAQLSAGARQAERDAWQLATLESASRPKTSGIDRLRARLAEGKAQP
jgi:hypothetical protein